MMSRSDNINRTKKVKKKMKETYMKAKYQSLPFSCPDCEMRFETSVEMLWHMGFQRNSQECKKSKFK